MLTSSHEHNKQTTAQQTNDSTVAWENETKQTDKGGKGKPLTEVKRARIFTPTDDPLGRLMNANLVTLTHISSFN